jgi:hypothetical protein
MRIWKILGATVLGLFVMTDPALSQRGGAARSGMRGAVVGDMLGGSEGAAKGAKIGVVTGATRSAIDRETIARTQYQTTAEYKDAPQSNFNETPPDILGVTPADKEAKAGDEVVIRVNKKPLVGVTFPTDWKQKTGDNYVAAVSKDRQAFAMFAALEGADKEAGVKRVKERLEKSLSDVKFDEQAETKGGALVVTGTGKGKKGVEVVFAAGIFEGAKGQLVGAAFVVDSKVDEHYKETMRGICQTIRRAEDFPAPKPDAPKPEVVHSYQWTRASDADQIHLMDDGKQVGTWRYDEGKYYAYDGKTWSKSELPKSAPKPPE